MDGRGYPEGKKGDEIPVESRILAIADSYVAITSDRPHRPKAEGKEARERLLSGAGAQLDAGACGPIPGEGVGLGAGRRRRLVFMGLVGGGVGHEAVADDQAEHESE